MLDYKQLQQLVAETGCLQHSDNNTLMGYLVDETLIA